MPSLVTGAAPMAKSFKNLLAKMPKERRTRIEARARKTLKEIDQAAVSKMESQSDMYLSTLRRIGVLTAAA